MIAAWILYALLVGVLAGAGAMVLETLLRAHRLPTRWVWAGAMALTLFWPLGHLLVRHWPREATAVPLPDPTRMAVLDPLAVQVAPESILRSLDGPIVGVWILSSLALLALFALLVSRTRRMRREWRGAEADGHSVLFSQDLGPAVVGYLRPEIVLPGWCRELEEHTLRLILDHELEHLRAGDLRLILTAGILPILLPWHVPLWWQLKRLRLAAEGDCDLRVLRKYPERTRPYMELLLQVGGRASRTQALVAMLSEPEETLERRIRIMTMPIPKKPWIRGMLLTAVGGSLVALACWAPGPNDVPEEGARSVQVPPDIPIPGTPSRAAAELPPETAVTNPMSSEPGSDLSSTPTFTPYTVRPDIKNRAEVARSLEREYPPLLRDASIGGTTLVWFFLDEAGAVQRVMTNESSGHKALDEAALRVAGIIEFTPALNRDKKVPVWISLPITFRTAPRIPEPSSKISGGDISDAPTFTPYTVRPDIRNRAEVARALEEAYPLALRDEGVGGTIQVWFFIDENGVVQKTQINESSGHQALDDAALEVADKIGFTPARNEDKRVPVWISLPITFATRGTEPEEGQEGGGEPARIRIPPTPEELAAGEPPLPRLTEKEIGAAPTFTPYTVRPDIRNRTEIARALGEAYPPALRDEGVGGTVQVWFFIDENGVVQRTQVNETSGHEDLDLAALEVAGVIEFTPALNRDKAVPVWISLPITFTTR